MHNYPTFPDDEYRAANEAIRQEILHHDPENTWLQSQLMLGQPLFLNAEATTRRMPCFRSMVLSGGSLYWPDCQIPGLSWFTGDIAQHVAASIQDLRRLEGVFRETCERLEAPWIPCAEDLIGEPYHYTVDGCIQTQVNLRYSLYVSLFEHFVATDGAVTLLEIGGSFGGLSGRLMERHPDWSLRFTEVPYLCPYADYYLRTKLGADPARPDRIRVLYPFELAQAEAADIAVNTMSFQHMTTANLNFYFSHMRRMGVSRIFSVNRSEGYKTEETPSFLKDAQRHGYEPVLSKSLEPWTEYHPLLVLARS